MCVCCDHASQRMFSNVSSARPTRETTTAPTRSITQTRTSERPSASDPARSGSESRDKASRSVLVGRFVKMWPVLPSDFPSRLSLTSFSLNNQLHMNVYFHCSTIIKCSLIIIFAAGLVVWVSFVCDIKRYKYFFPISDMVHVILCLAIGIFLSVSFLSLSGRFSVIINQVVTP